MKDKLGKTIILRPEDIDNSINSEEDLEKIKKNHSNNKNKRYSLKNMNIYKKMGNSSNNLKLIKNRRVSKSNKALVSFGLNNNNNNMNLIKTKLIRDLTVIDDFSEPSKKERRKKCKEKKIQPKQGSSKNNTSFEESLYSIQIKSTAYHEKLRALTHKKMVYDSLDDEEIEEEDDFSIYLDPNSTFTILFDAILLVFTCISFIEIPLYLATSKSFCRQRKITFVFIINVITEILYLIDFLFGFFRAYYNFEEQLITRRRKIFKKYISGWFFFDFCASVPIYIINKYYEPLCT